MRMKEAEQLVSKFLRDNFYPLDGDKPTFMSWEDTEHRGKKAWIIYTKDPKEGIFIVYHDTGEVEDFYKPVTANVTQKSAP